MKKFELTSEFVTNVFGVKLFRIRALVYGDADYATVKGFGRYNRNTTFFRCKDGKIRVVCGCFFGDLEEFRAIVKCTHGDGKLAKEYLAIADLMEMHFAKEGEDDTSRNPQQV